MHFLTVLQTAGPLLWAGGMCPGPGAGCLHAGAPGEGQSSLWLSQQLAAGSGMDAEPAPSWGRRTGAGEPAGDVWDSGATQWQSAWSSGQHLVPGRQPAGLDGCPEQELRTGATPRQMDRPGLCLQNETPGSWPAQQVSLDSRRRDAAS